MTYVSTHISVHIFLRKMLWWNLNKKHNICLDINIILSDGCKEDGKTPVLTRVELVNGK